MPTSLTNKEINLTYPGLIKTIDNAELGPIPKQLTDGVGNPLNIAVGDDLTQFDGTVDFTNADVIGLDLSGDQGPQGPQGVAGSNGINGTQGVQGPIGAQGSVGPQGIAGPQGFQGNIGHQGPAGPQGLVGPTGNVGAQGAMGYQGLTGQQGPQGLIGSQGLQGPQGPSATQSLNQTLLVGNTASSTILLDKGGVSQPSYSFNGDSDTGFTSLGDNTANIIVGGGSKTSYTRAADIHFFRDATNAQIQALRWAADTTRTYLQPSKTGTTGSGSEIQIGKYLSSAQADALVRFNTETMQSAFNAGTGATPSITFIGDTNTGFFSNAADEIGLTTGGSTKILFGPTQSVFNTNVDLNAVVDFTDATVIGLNLPAGPQGAQGFQGPQGTNGANGSQGLQGPQGPAGTQGTDGLLTLTGTTDNGVITLNGSAPNGTVEQNLTFDGSTLNVNSVRVGRGSGNLPQNAAIGLGALINNTTGTGLFAFGNGTLGANTTGNSNVGVGGGAVGRNQVGSRNVGVGRFSLDWSKGDDNTAAGNEALKSIGTLIWDEGLQTYVEDPNATTYDNNIAIGSSAGSRLKQGANNVYIGYIGEGIDPETGWGTDVSNNSIYLAAGQTNLRLVIDENGAAEFKGQVYSLIENKGNSGTSLNVNWNDSNIQTITLNDNVTLTFSNPKAGSTYQLIITQDGVGGRSINWPTIIWKDGTAPTLSTNPNSKNVILFTYDGTSYLGHLWAGATGSMGAQGLQGPQGPIGLQGSIGQQGSTGAQGPIGLQGSNGTNGAQGAQGPIGLQGSVGQQGSVGAQGFQGRQGPVGPQGIVGSTGSQGFQGPIGLQGSTGAQGFQGRQGPAGTNGTNGNQGPQGPAGSNGSNGAQGPIGPQGPQGVPGPVTINNNANNRVITATGTAALDAETNLTFDGSTLAVAGSITATGDITAYFSDDRLKTRLGNINNALDKVAKLNGFYYEPNSIAESYGYIKKKEVGISAQEIEAILPELIKDAPIGDGYKTVDYSRVVPLLIEAIKELRNEIDILKYKC